MIDPRDFDELDFLICLTIVFLSLILFSGCVSAPRSGGGPSVRFFTARPAGEGVELRRKVAGEDMIVLTPLEADGYQCLSRDDLAALLKALAN